MINRIFFVIFFCSFANLIFGQSYINYSDKLLNNSFKLFQSADFELADHILPFLEKRFIEELEDTTSFSNPYDSLSKRINIKYSSDSLLKTYCWSERNGGCCHGSVSYAQFKTESGEIKYINLEEPIGNGKETFITDLQRIEINNSPHYLILGWGTCCGGKHYGIAKIYEIKDGHLIQVADAFNDEPELYVGANRSQNIELKYSPETKTLSYNSYPYDEDIGFYKHEKSNALWELKKKGFEQKK